MSEIFDIENIVDHRIGENGKIQYCVKWKGYDSSNNTWEPQENFMSMKIIEEYHYRLNSSEGKENEVQKKRRETDSNLVLISEHDIITHKLVPIKVLNIHHQYGNEKALVALVQFLTQEDKKETGFVPAAWANVHCPQMVIRFYESRIFWKNKHTGELNKCAYY